MKSVLFVLNNKYTARNMAFNNFKFLMKPLETVVNIRICTNQSFLLEDDNNKNQTKSVIYRYVGSNWEIKNLWYNKECGIDIYFKSLLTYSYLLTYFIRNSCTSRCIIDLYWSLTFFPHFFPLYSSFDHSHYFSIAMPTSSVQIFLDLPFFLFSISLPYKLAFTSSHYVFKPSKLSLFCGYLDGVYL